MRNPRRTQTPGGGGFSDCGGVGAFGAGEVHPARASEQVASLVRAPAKLYVYGSTTCTRSAHGTRSYRFATCFEPRDDIRNTRRANRTFTRGIDTGYVQAEAVICSGG